MQRVVEPELMNEQEQVLAYAQADFSEPHNRFIELFAEHFPSFSSGGKKQVVDLGCGPGDISLRFARRYPEASIIGIDGAPQMLKLGHQALDEAGLAERIQLVEHYLPCEQLPCQEADAVISNSLLHHLHQPQVLWQSISQMTQSGSAIFIMDLMRPPSVEIAEAMRQQYVADEPEILQVDFYNSLLAAFTLDEVEAQLQKADLTQLQVEAVSDRHLIIYGTC